MARSAARRPLLASVAILALYLLARTLGVNVPPIAGGARDEAPPARAEARARDAAADAALLADLYREGRSDTWVEAEGVVVATLRDDLHGSRHQRFVVRVSPGQTVLVSHNIDLAPRIPLEKGDRVSFRGEYEWNEKGGVVHWTHHDPDGRHAGGWVELDGRRFR